MSPWSEAAASVWGKLDPDTASWLPLVTHLEHAAAMAGHLWDHFFPASIRALLCDDLGCPDAAARTLYCYYAGIHDVGKSSPAFAVQAEGRGMPFILDRMRDHGLSVRSIAREHNVRHEVISQVALADWLIEDLGARLRAANTWASVVGGHHGRYPDASLVVAAMNRPDIIGAGRWAEVRREILVTMAERTGVGAHWEAWLSRRLPLRAQVLLTSMVVVADWLASNQEYFPYLDELAPAERAAEAFEALELPEPWCPAIPDADVTQLLRTRFPVLAGASPTAAQSALVEVARACPEPPLLIVEEQMGRGKTEGALLAAEILAARFGQGGLYIGLPTMATANPMFSRALAWLPTVLGDRDASVTLAHGKAGLNDEYAGLLRGEPWRGQVYEDESAEAGLPVVNGWLRGRRKAGLADFTVGTIDQGLFVALKAKHVALRHLGLAGKVVVVDEVHAADVYMREYLKRTLTWLGAYRTPVILLSATLPPDQRDEYVAAYALGRGDRAPGTTDRQDSYPRLTCYDGALRDTPVSRDAPHVGVRLERIADDPAGVAALLETLLAEGGCAGVLCNTVARAQDAYRALRARFGDDVLLAHSRFIAPDRASRERRLVSLLGRDSAQRPHRLIVVGTQVLEQSLDVDFDVMVSDLAPADLVLQRVGRLHRHARDARPDAVAQPTLYLRGVDDWGDAPPRAVRGSRAVYGEAPLLRAAAVLAGRGSLDLPFDIPALVRRAYAADFAAPAGWEARWQAAEQRAAADAARARSRSQTYLLADPDIPADLMGWVDVASPDPERSEEQGRSQVRDTEDSLEVIALWRDSDGILRLPACAPHHPGAAITEGLQWGLGSDMRLAREMASCTLSLPIQLTNPRVIDRAIAELEASVDYSGWQQSPWIREQLVLVFGPDDRAQLAGFDLQYTPDEGLVVTHSEEEM